jgi:hypothetical protein
LVVWYIPCLRFDEVPLPICSHPAPAGRDKHPVCGISSSQPPLTTLTPPPFPLSLTRPPPPEPLYASRLRLELTLQQLQSGAGSSAGSSRSGEDKAAGENQTLPLSPSQVAAEAARRAKVAAGGRGIVVPAGAGRGCSSTPLLRKEERARVEEGKIGSQQRVHACTGRKVDERGCAVGL